MSLACFRSSVPVSSASERDPETLTGIDALNSRARNSSLISIKSFKISCAVSTMIAVKSFTARVIPEFPTNPMMEKILKC